MPQLGRFHSLGGADYNKVRIFSWGSLFFSQEI